MADVKLNSLKFPNLPDRYILDAGKVEYHEADTFEEDTVGKALQHKAEVDGSYESMTVGNAEQLVSNVRVNDKTPYLFRTSGGSVDIGDREYVGGIVGGTVAWNQLLKNADFASGMQNWSIGHNATASVSNGVLTAVANGTPTGNQYINQSGLAIPSGHKLLWSAEIASNNAQISVQGVQSSPWTTVFTQNVSVTSTLTPKAGVVAVGSGNTVNNFFFNFDNKENIIIKSPQLFDLTQMFGSTVADYIYALEQANAGAGVAFFNKLFPNLDAEYTWVDAQEVSHTQKLRDYQTGILQSVSGLVSHDMTGFNQWDEEWELGRFDTTTGANVSSSTQIRCKNYIPVLPNTTYYFNANPLIWVLFFDADKNAIPSGASTDYSRSGNSVNVGRGLDTFRETFTAPQGARYMRFYCTDAYGTTYKNDICINISWDGSRNGEYEPYELHSYPLDSDLTLRGIPKLDANNNLYYDGDTYEADGTVTRKYGIVDLGTLNWTTDVGQKRFYSTELSNSAKPETDEMPFALVSSGFTAVSFIDGYGYTTRDKIFFISTAGAISVRWLDHTDDTATQFKSAVSGIYLVYKLDAPTTETADPYQQTQVVNDFGTEEYVIDSNTFAVPVGSDTDYPVNLVAKLEMAPNSPDGSGDYIVRQTNGVNEYVPLVIEDALPTIPSTAGTYTLTVTVTDGADPVLSWEA